MQKRIRRGGLERKRTASFAVKIQNTKLSKPFRFELSNGVAIVGENIPSVESIAIGMWVNVGSRDEKKEENGLTHLIEHMAFKGTGHFTAEEMVESVENRGGYINAFTTKEFSCYYAKVFKADIEAAVRVLSDLILYPKFSENDLRNERKVVLAEMQEVYDDPEDWGMDFLEEKIFDGNSLSMPILGKSSALKGFGVRDLFAFHSRNFTAERIVVSIAGNFDRGLLMNLADKYLSPAAASSRFLKKKSAGGGRRLLSSEGPEGPHGKFRPVTSSREYVVHRDTGKQGHVLAAFPAAGLNDPDRYACSMAGVILGDGSSSRLHKELREKEGLAYSIYSYGSAYYDTGILGIYSCTGVKDVLKVEKKIIKVVEEFLRNGPTKDEVDRAKAQLKAGIIFSLESLWDRASLFARDELYYCERSSLSESLAAIEKVTDADIALAAKKYLTPQDGLPRTKQKMGSGTSDRLISLKILPNENNVVRRSR